MNYFFSPINLDDWDIFKKVNAVGYQDTFRATKEMQVGDVVLFYVAANQRREPGVYACGRIVRPPELVTGHPKDKCNGKVAVVVSFLSVPPQAPLVPLDGCKAFLWPFMGPHRIQEEKLRPLLDSFPIAPR